MDTVSRIMKYVTSFNTASSNAHYPVIAVSYGYIAFMKAMQVRDAVIL